MADETIQLVPLGPHARLFVADTAKHIAPFTADRIEATLQHKPDAVFCAATGASPLTTYRELARRASSAPESFARFRLVKLDEWGTLSADDPASCEAYLRQELVSPLKISEDRYLAFAGNAPDPTAECARIDRQLDRWGRIDLSILGLGVNGHIGFNEPADALSETAHVAKLSDASLNHAMLTRTSAKPTHGLTLGMGQLLRSRQIILIVQGKTKTDPMHRLLTKQISTEFPASLLWLHPDFTIVTDREALAECEHLLIDPVGPST